MPNQLFPVKRTWQIFECRLCGVEFINLQEHLAEPADYDPRAWWQMPRWMDALHYTPVALIEDALHPHMDFGVPPRCLCGGIIKFAWKAGQYRCERCGHFWGED